MGKRVLSTYSRVLAVLHWIGSSRLDSRRLRPSDVAEALVQAFWTASQTLGARNPCFRVPFLQAFAWIRKSFEVCLRNEGLSTATATPRSDLDDVDASSAGLLSPRMLAGVQQSNDAAPEQQNEPANSSAVHQAAPKRAPAIERYSDAFVSRMTITDHMLHLALLDTTALWLDHVPAQVFATLLAVLLEVGRGSLPAEHSPLLLAFLSRAAPAVSLHTPARQGSFVATGAEHSPACAVATQQVTSNARVQYALDNSPSSNHDAGELKLEFERALPLQPEFVPPGSVRSAGGNTSEVSELWLSTDRLDSLAWLEQRLPHLEGLVQSVLQQCHSWFSAAMAECPWHALPAPFNTAPAFERVLVTIALNSAMLHAALCWYCPMVATPLCQWSPCARALRCIETSPTNPIALLHSRTPVSPSEAVRLLAAAHSSGVADPSTTRSSVLTALTAPQQDSLVCPPEVGVLHLSSSTTAACVEDSITTSCVRGQWLLLAFIHLRPDLVATIVRTHGTAVVSSSSNSAFRLLLYCPTQRLPDVTFRNDMQLVMLGGASGIEPRVLQLLHTLDLPLAARARFTTPVSNTAFTLAQQAMFQRVVLGVFLGLAAVAEACEKVGVLSLLAQPSKLCTAPQVAHCVYAVRLLVQRCTSVSMLDFRQVRTAILEVRNPVLQCIGWCRCCPSQLVKQEST